MLKAHGVSSDSSRQGRRTWLAIPVAVFLAGFLVMFIPAAANAGVADSAYGYYTVYGHQYQNQAIISTSTGSAVGFTYNSWYTGSNPTGWAGAQGRVFSSGGTLECHGTIEYNSAPGYVAGSDCVYYASGAYYSYGVAYGWNGSGYSPFYTYKSPNQNS
jgi:hypothetical protein